jgi:hypothetical protein
MRDTGDESAIDPAGKSDQRGIDVSDRPPQVVVLLAHGRDQWRRMN